MAKRINVGVKGTVARLLATENLSVEHRKAKTASFDVVRRVLVLPCLQNVGDDVYDMFVGHEVGHAIITPKNWAEAAKLIDPKNPGLARQYLNVVEDPRVERYIKNKYPGLRATFNRAYQELFQAGFMGNEEPNKLPLVDRINLFFKLGPVCGVSFSTEEALLVNAVNNCITYDDVVETATQIYKSAKEPPREPQENPDEEPDEQNGSDGADEDSEAQEDTSEASEDPSEETDGQPKEQEAPASTTQDALNQHFERSAITTGLDTLYLEVPEVRLHNIVTDYPQVHDPLHMAVETDMGRALSQLKAFQARNRDTISFIYQQFERKKRAWERQHTKLKKSGIIDTNRLYAYKFTDNIFLKRMSQPTGKNHGLLMYVDWSMSMQSSIRGVIEQVMCLAYFCRKARIPFEVFAINSREYDKDQVIPESFSKKPQELWMEDRMALRVLLTSRMTAAEFHTACFHLLAMFVQNKQMKQRSLPQADKLGRRTPLDETMACILQQAPGFKAAYGLDIVNVVVLTDSAGTTGGQYCDIDGKQTTMDPKKFRYVVRDRVTHSDFVIQDAIDTGKSRVASPATALRQLVVQRTGVNLIGFFVADSEDITDILHSVASPPEITAIGGKEALQLKFKTERCLAMQTSGYTEFYVVAGGEALLTEAEKTGQTLTEQCHSYSASKTLKKVVLSRFVDLIT